MSKARHLNKASYWMALLALAGLLLFCTLSSSTARAQPAVSLASLQISLWPEYDKPSTLVILDGQVAAGVSLPAELTIHIPTAAGAPNAVAVVGTNGGLFQTPYNTSVVGGDIIIKFTASSAGFRVEYYDPGLTFNGNTRSYAFRWKSDTAIADVTVRVQEPYGAHNLAGQPALAPAGVGEFGLNYYAASVGALGVGGTVALELGYTKTGAALTVSAQKSGTAAPATAAAPSRPWILVAAALGLAAIGGGVVWVVRRPRGARNAARALGRRGRRHAAGAESAGGVQRPVAAPVSFCTQCGQPQAPADRFCRKCGTAVRQ